MLTVGTNLKLRSTVDINTVSQQSLFTFCMFQPNQIFGHGGYGGQYAASDIKHKVGFAYTTSFLDPFSSYNQDGDPRMFSLFKALYQCIYEIEGNQEPVLTFKFHSQFKKYMDEKGLKSHL